LILKLPLSLILGIVIRGLRRCSWYQDLCQFKCFWVLSFQHSCEHRFAVHKVLFVSIVWALFSLQGPSAWSSLDKPWSGSSLV
ncbi:25123_t:CDS:2, partial [Dentiscutata erythropus]